ncbi:MULTISPECIES: hypothetical protein [Ramlibacter]|uniref:Pyridoxamine 5'-phosphate oxidase putative domain-containing protein n=1 Tax=Ramlibacter pinisoli TaxID=2682844 RepID=A0A6N8IUN9_9BURK|nr:MULTISPECIES: hypothetical protein [Ramlibacter]MBA2965301.1 hypothetical protein [Ramlibacter sp. CGMCC 1.13660]MVQ30265.1 hypothetical protein [Ramlibacter pinisoli]
MAGVTLPGNLLAMIARGVSANVASRDAALRPSLMRAVGSAVSPDGATVTVYLARSQSRQLVQDIASTGHLAVVFSEPATHCTVQLKARRASLRDATEADRPLLARYLASMEHEIGRVGHPPAIARAMLAYRLEDLVAVSFQAEQAFEQTPGPLAGRTIGGSA